jgi:hypothetical protein
MSLNASNINPPGVVSKTPQLPTQLGALREVVMELVDEIGALEQRAAPVCTLEKVPEEANPEPVLVLCPAADDVRTAVQQLRGVLQRMKSLYDRMEV